jgi:type I restriction enzyme M protein
VKLKVIPLPVEHKLLDLAKRHGSGNLLRDALSPFAFFILLRWAVLQEKEEEAIALFEDRDYEPVLPGHLSWSSLIQFDEPDLFHVLHGDLLPTLENLHNSPLADILRNAAYAFDPKKLTGRLLHGALRIVADIPFNTPEDIAEVDKIFQRVNRQVLEETRYAGEFITPNRVARLMLDIAAPKPGETIYDPCFGLGTLIAGAARRVSKAARALDPSHWLHLQSKALFGVEASPVAYLVGLTRVILAGVSRPQLALGDTLERDLRSAYEQYDLVLAAPPIGGKVSDRALLQQFPIRTSSTESLFLQHIMRALKPNGRAVVALPEGVLFRGGAEEQLRQHLLFDFFVEGVISLPAGSLQPYTSVKPNLIVFRRAEPAEFVWFQEVQPTGKSTNRAVVFDAKLEAARFRDRQESKTAWLTPVAEIAEGNYDLTVRRRQGVALDTLFKDVLEHEKYVGILPLEEVADVISGIGYTRRETTKEPTPDSLPLIRVTELTKSGDLKPPTLFLSGPALERARGRRLQTGDIILSTQGTIGKVGIVREAFADSVPAHGITVIRIKDETRQKYTRQMPDLVTLLRSELYQQWLTAHAFGTTIKNVPVRDLRRLPLLLLKPEYQEAYSRFSANDISRPKDFASYIEGLKDDPVFDFLANDPTVTAIAQSGFDPEDTDEQMRRLAAALHEVSDIARSRPGISVDDAFIEWLRQAALLVDTVVDAYGLTGAERLATLDIMQRDLEQLGTTPQHPSALVRADLTLALEAVGKEVAEERERILSGTKVSARLEPAIIEAEKETEITLWLFNEGGLPLRMLSVETSPLPGPGSRYLLAAGEEASWTLVAPASPEGTYPLKVSWTALRIDNAFASGDLELSYSVRGTQTSNAATFDLRSNPYVVGNPLVPGGSHDMFYGREDIIDQIRRSLRAYGPSTVILLEGNRRAGKTSILYRLQVSGTLPGWIPVYCSFQRAEGNKSAAGLDTAEVFYQIARELVLAVSAAGFQVDTPGVGIVPGGMSSLALKKQLRSKLRPEFVAGNPFEQLDLLAESVGGSIDDRRVVLLLDEFDKIQEGIDNGVTSPQVPENLRSLFHTHDKISAILTGGRRIKHLRESNWSAFYGIGIPILIDALEPEASRRLIVEPVQGRLTYAENAREHVIDLTSGQPFLIQGLCYRVFEQCVDTATRNVTLKTVEAAANQMVEGNEHFRTVFDFIGDDRPRYVACVVNRLSEGVDRVTFDRILEELEKDRISYEASDLADDLKHLQELDVVDLEQHEHGSSYRIKIPLFARWLSRNIHDLMYRQQAAEG